MPLSIASFGLERGAFTRSPHPKLRREQIRCVAASAAAAATETVIRPQSELCRACPSAKRAPNAVHTSQGASHGAKDRPGSLREEACAGPAHVDVPTEKTYMSPSSKKDDGVVSEPLNMLQSAHNVESACQDDQN